MTTKPYLVAAQEVGLELDMEPWLLPDSAYVSLEDAYMWRKRGRRRMGNRYVGRLVEETTKTYAAHGGGAWNNATDPLASQPITNVLIDTPGVGFTRLVFGTNYLGSGETFVSNGITGTVGAVLNNQSLVVVGPTGTTVDVAVTSTGLVYGGGGTAYLESLKPGSTTVVIAPNTYLDNGSGVLTLGGVAAGTIDYFTGNLTIAAAPAGVPTVEYSFYPQLPVMGIKTLETLLNEAKVTIAFDTDQSNKFLNTSFIDINYYTLPGGILGAGEHFKWVGTDLDFFDSLNYQNAFFATNGVAGFHVQQIAGVTVDTPAPGSTRISFASNVIAAGESVFIMGVTGTVGTVLNGLTFVVSAAALGAGGSIDIPATSTGLAYTAGGTVFVNDHKIYGDGIRWYAEQTIVKGWVNFNPPINATYALKGANILLTYRGRMLALNTQEGLIGTTADVVKHPNRVRWSQIGTTFYTNPVPDNQGYDAEAWRDDIPGKGSFADAPTTEAIIGAEFIRDTLVVFFEQSTWQLRYVGNPAQPFVWTRINVEFGSMSQFSTVAFDRGILAISNRGIITADGNNVARIDLIIPDKVFSFTGSSTSAPNKDALKRVHGVRDFKNELVFWTYADNSADDLRRTTFYPNKLLVYNYRENSYSVFNDIYTCFGNISWTTSLTWDEATINWEAANFAWNSSSYDYNTPQIVAGTPTGFVMLINAQSLNEKQYQIIGITKGDPAVVTTCGPHNLDTDQYVKISDIATGMPEIENLNSKIRVISATSFQCLDIDSTAFTDYVDGGFATIINNFSVVTKRFNPFVSSGKSVLLKYIDFYLNYYRYGQFSVYIYCDNNSNTPVNLAIPGGFQTWQSIVPLDQITTNALLGDKIWIRFNCQARGQFIQFEMSMNHDQMLDDDINAQDFQWHAFLLHLGTSGRLII